MVTPRIIARSSLINYWHKQQPLGIHGRRVRCVGLLFALFSAGCDESTSPASKDSLRAHAPEPIAQQAPVLTTQSRGSLGGTLQLAPGITAIYGVEYAGGKARLRAAAVLRGAQGWQDRTLVPTGGTKRQSLKHVGIGASVGSHSVVFDPAADQLWIDDKQAMPLGDDNVWVFQVPEEPSAALALASQQHTDPSLGSVPAQGLTRLMKERVRVKLNALATLGSIDRR